MNIFGIVLVLVVAGIVWTLLRPYIGEPFRTLIIIVCLLYVCWWLLRLAGAPVPRFS